MAQARVEFANALRGPAALAVLASHYLGTFWLDHPATMEPMKLAPIVEAMQIPYVSTWLFPNIPFNWGGFGVGLFFLISGFVIPFSLQRLNATGFLIARAIRVLPVYAVGFLIGIASLAILYAQLGRPFPFSPLHLAVHAVAGLRAIIPFDRIDGVVWTIEMEVRFYVVCALMAGFVARGSLKAFVAPFILFLACVVMGLLGDVSPVSLAARIAWKTLTIAALNGPFLMFMFIGVAINFHFRRFLSSGRLVAAIVILWSLFLAGIAITPSTLTHASIGSYAAALVVFLIAYRFQGAWATAWPLRFFADISYPLYAVHAVLGYAIIYALVRTGFPALGAVAVATVVSITFSAVLHYLVEIPSRNWAQTLGRAWSDRASARKTRRTGPAAELPAARSALATSE